MQIPIVKAINLRKNWNGNEIVKALVYLRRLPIGTKHQYYECKNEQNWFILAVYLLNMFWRNLSCCFGIGTSFLSLLVTHFKIDSGTKHFNRTDHLVFGLWVCIVLTCVATCVSFSLERFCQLVCCCLHECCTLFVFFGVLCSPVIWGNLVNNLTAQSFLKRQFLQQRTQLSGQNQQICQNSVPTNINQTPKHSTKMMRFTAKP